MKTRCDSTAESSTKLPALAGNETWAAILYATVCIVLPQTILSIVLRYYFVASLRFFASKDLAAG